MYKLVFKEFFSNIGILTNIFHLQYMSEVRWIGTKIKICYLLSAIYKYILQLISSIVSVFKSESKIDTFYYYWTVF